MAEEEFDIAKWFKPDSGVQDRPLSGAAAPRIATQDLHDDIETVVRRIEARCLDITGDYSSWRDVGFALADGLGEAGRDYYHRVSRFYPKYDVKETDKQYDRCVKGKKGGITVKTFFQKAKDMGVDIKTRQIAKLPILPISPAEKSDDIAQSSPSGNFGDLAISELMPTFSDAIETDLPHFLQLVAARGNDSQEKDVLILGTIVTLSACLPNVSGLYNEVDVFPNLYFFLTARASSGKGRLNLCRLLVEAIHERLFEIYRLEKEEYEMKKREFDTSKTPGITRPTPPVKNMLFIPANSSATSVYQILGESNERGLIFETEGDTLAYSFASDFGNFSDGFRKAFHHESISYHRRKDDEHVDLKHPQLSTVLSGTPEQLKSLIKDAENGLFSRFIYYRLNTGLVWKDVFANPTGKSLNTVFEELGQRFAEFHETLMKADAMKFCLNAAQIVKFNAYFNNLQKRLFKQYGDPIIASVRRMGLICFRIAMILTTLRIMETGDFGTDLICSNDDFDTTMTMVRVLIEHTQSVYEELCCGGDIPPQMQNTQKTKFYDALPDAFERTVYMEVAAKLNIPDRSADRYIKQLCQSGSLEKQRHGAYAKTQRNE